VTTFVRSLTGPKTLKAFRNRPTARSSIRSASDAAVFARAVGHPLRLAVPWVRIRRRSSGFRYVDGPACACDTGRKPSWEQYYDAFHQE
jgi:hypothetical protein